jgi:predicted  nucleic acid-binding Zn-ribbon protein
VTTTVRAREPFVVVELTDGVADTSVGHLPAPWRERRVGGERVYHELFDERVSEGITPDSWPGACGVTGPVYTAAGALDGIEICRACRSARSSRLIAEGLRVDACVQCGSAFEQKAGRRGRPLELCPSCRGKVKEVVAEKKRAYREANRQEIAEKKRAYYEANRQEIAEKQRAYYEANRQEIAEKQRAYREANRQEIAEKQRAYREANRQEIAEKQRAYYEVRTLGVPTTRRGDDGLWHLLHKGASHTLCGRQAPEYVRGRKWPATCPDCIAETQELAA